MVARVGLLLVFLVSFCVFGFFFFSCEQGLQSISWAAAGAGSLWALESRFNEGVLG